MLFIVTKHKSQRSQNYLFLKKNLFCLHRLIDKEQSNSFVLGVRGLGVRRLSQKGKIKERERKNSST